MWFKGVVWSPNVIVHVEDHHVMIVLQLPLRIFVSLEKVKCGKLNLWLHCSISFVNGDLFMLAMSL